MNRAVRRSCERLANCSWPARLQGIRLSLILAASRRRLDLDTLRPWSFDFPPESCRGRISGDAKYLGNFPPIKSSATRAKHGSTLINKDCDQRCPNSGWRTTNDEISSDSPEAVRRTNRSYEDELLRRGQQSPHRGICCFDLEVRSGMACITTVQRTGARSVC